MASKPRVKEVKDIPSSSFPLVTSTSPAHSNSVAPGPLGTRSGVYRPCARCRVKKTKCDKQRPACSSCVKGGADLTCVYDNDEPTSGDDNGNDDGPTVATSSTISSSAGTEKESDHQSEKATSEATQKGRKSGGGSAASAHTPRSTNGHGTRSSNGNIDSNGGGIDVESFPQATSTIKRSGYAEPPLKKLNMGAVSSEAIKPSPLRSSITTIKIPAIKSFTSATNETDPTLDENVDIESVDVVEDKYVSELAIVDASANRVPSEANQEDAADAIDALAKRVPSEANQEDAADAIDALAKRASSSTGASVRQKKQPKGTSVTASITGGGNQSKIVVDPPTAKPAPTFVIDKNQKARKWGRSGTVVQTLGGEIFIPLWISDQEMLLNEPRPYFTQRSYPMPTLSSSAASSTSATATNLARMAVLNQMDNNNGYDTPDRGTTPESGESSPVPPSSPLLKKKSGLQKQRAVANNDDDMDPATTSNISRTGVKRKRAPYSFSAGSGSTTTATGGGGGDDDGGDSSARSTPAPTSRPRPVPTRPRMYPCSFEGCGKSFMDKFHLKRHEKRHVTQVIVCGIDGCTKAYDSISTMRRHQSMVHKERKEEIAAAAAAVAAIAASPSDAESLKRSPGMVEEYGDEEDGQSENSGSSPAPSSVTYTAVSSPMRD